jgi:hypothetical protein
MFSPKGRQARDPALEGGHCNPRLNHLCLRCVRPISRFVRLKFLVTKEQSFILTAFLFQPFLAIYHGRRNQVQRVRHESRVCGLAHEERLQSKPRCCLVVLYVLPGAHRHFIRVACSGERYGRSVGSLYTDSKLCTWTKNQRRRTWRRYK